MDNDIGNRFYFTGDSHGFYSMAYWDADRRYAFVFMSNTLLPNWFRPRLASALVDILEERRPAPINSPLYGISGITPESWNLYAGLPHLDDFGPILGEYEMHPAGKLTIENPSSNWLNIGWMLKDGWFAPVLRVNGGLRYNIFPVEPGMFYAPGFDAWIGFKDGDKGPVIYWTTVFDGTATGTRISK